MVRQLEHGMVLDAKKVMDDPMPFLRQRLRDMVPAKLQGELAYTLELFEDELVSCDISKELSLDGY